MKRPRGLVVCKLQATSPLGVVFLAPDYAVKMDRISYRDISAQGKIPFQFNLIKKGDFFESELIINSGCDWDDSLEELNNRT